MSSFLRKHQKSIFIATMATFFGGMFVGFGGYMLTNRDMQGVVARVGKVKITNEALMTRVDLYADRLREQGTELDDDKLKALKREMLNNMMVDEMLAIKADQLGFVVTDEELARDIRATPAFNRGGQFDQEAYFQAVRETFHESPQDYEADRRKAIETSRLKSFFYREVKVSPDDLREAYAMANKGSMKKFEKEKDAFAGRLQQERALELVNYCLHQMQSQVEVQNLLDRVDNGA
ncbi:MAG TPA: SurA N-terminal domain-containing protein [Elusimicrobiota bacterium]|nr:SurA N-terminal domain-containing protein [Elusimicrobiota bacterium]